MTRFKHKYQCDWVTTEVTKIEEKNKRYKDKFKCAFYCKSPTGIPRLCIAWGEHNIEVGDTVEMKGRIENNVFLCRKLFIKSRNLPEQEGV